MLLDLFNSIDKSILEKAECNSSHFLSSIKTVSEKYGASWVDIILHFEWHVALDEMFKSSSNSFE